MPIYSYVCDECGYRYYDYQNKYIGSQEYGCPNCFREINPKFMRRDYNDEKPTMMPDWEPGYNIGIDYHYSSKGDLMREIKRRGLLPSVHGGGITSTNAKPGLYGDEEFHDMYAPSQPTEDDQGGQNMEVEP